MARKSTQQRDARPHAYTPVQHGAGTDSRGFPPQVLVQDSSSLYETPKMTKPFTRTANPVSPGDRTSGRGRYEKGKRGQTRSG